MKNFIFLCLLLISSTAWASDCADYEDCMKGSDAMYAGVDLKGKDIIHRSANEVDILKTIAYKLDSIEKILKEKK